MKKIVVVDDDPGMLEFLAYALKGSFDVQTASDGAAGLEVIKSHRPDLVILDVLMPVMDGYSCLREINAQVGRGKLPIIVLTGRDRMKDLFELEGIEDYVIKPFDHEDLLVRIDRALKRYADNRVPGAP